MKHPLSFSSLLIAFLVLLLLGLGLVGAHHDYVEVDACRQQSGEPLFVSDTVWVCIPAHTGQN
jgi:hypothetical protein